VNAIGGLQLYVHMQETLLYLVEKLIQKTRVWKIPLYVFSPLSFPATNGVTIQRREAFEEV
jgi:hypothetical protein